MAFGVVLALMGATVALAVVTLDRQDSAARKGAALETLTRQLDEQKFYDADISGWQVAYAWDAYRLGPAKAATGSAEIASAIIQVAEGTSASRSSATVATRAAQDVRTLADDLERLVARFTV